MPTCIWSVQKVRLVWTFLGEQKTNSTKCEISCIKNNNFSRKLQQFDREEVFIISILGYLQKGQIFRCIQNYYLNSNQLANIARSEVAIGAAGQFCGRERSSIRIDTAALVVVDLKHSNVVTFGGRPAVCYEIFYEIFYKI